MQIRDSLDDAIDALIDKNDNEASAALLGTTVILTSRLGYRAAAAALDDEGGRLGDLSSRQSLRREANY